MRRILHKWIRFAVFVYFSLHVGAGAFAQSPITIEQLLAKPATWQLSSSLDYRSVMSAAGMFERQSNVSTGVRYGVSSRLELNAQLQMQQFTLAGAVPKVREQNQAISVGANWLAMPESNRPALLLEARAMLASSGAARRQYLSGGQFAVTTYKSIDPLVLSLSTSINLQRGYRLDSVTVSPGSSWRIAPGVNFAANSSVTLFGGAAFERRNATGLGSGRVLGPTERLGIHAGVALSVARAHSLFVTADLATDRSGGMRVQWFYEF